MQNTNYCIYFEWWKSQSRADGAMVQWLIGYKGRPCSCYGANKQNWAKLTLVLSSVTWSLHRFTRHSGLWEKWVSICERNTKDNVDLIECHSKVNNIYWFVTTSTIHCIDTKTLWETLCCRTNFLRKPDQFSHFGWSLHTKGVPLVRLTVISCNMGKTW